MAKRRSKRSLVCDYVTTCEGLVTSLVPILTQIPGCAIHSRWFPLAITIISDAQNYIFMLRLSAADKKSRQTGPPRYFHTHVRTHVFHVFHLTQQHWPSCTCCLSFLLSSFTKVNAQQWHTWKWHMWKSRKKVLWKKWAVGSQHQVEHDCLFCNTSGW